MGCMDRAVKNCLDFFDRSKNVIYFSSALNLITEPSIGPVMGWFLIRLKNVTSTSLPNQVVGLGFKSPLKDGNFYGNLLFDELLPCD
jgi:hypothetical protein